jgi:hypothetical protein
MKEQKGEGKNKKEGCARGCTGRTVAETVLAGVAAEPICVFLPWPVLFFLLFLFFAGTLFFLLYHGTLFFAREQGKTIGAGAKHGEMRGTQARTPGRWSKTRGKNVGLRA